MVHSVSPANNSQPAAPVAVTNRKAAQPNDANVPKNDTVQLSSAAMAALKEATETPAQTAKEAVHGDHQAQRLLAKQKPVKHA